VISEEEQKVLIKNEQDIKDSFWLMVKSHNYKVAEDKKIFY